MYKKTRTLAILLTFTFILSFAPMLSIVSQQAPTAHAAWNGLEILIYPKGHKDSGNDMFGDFVTHSWFQRTDVEPIRSNSGGTFASTSHQADPLRRTWNDVIKITDTVAMTFTLPKVNRSLTDLRGETYYPLLSKAGYDQLFLQGVPNLQDYEYYIYYPSYNEEKLNTEITTGRSSNQSLAQDKLSRITKLVADGFIPIASLEDLNSIRSSEARTFAKGTPWQKEASGGLTRDYVQVADINANSTASWHNYTGFEPIGNPSSTNSNERRFRGTYDGQYFAIKNLYINRPDTSIQGLFGFTDGATIRNVVLANVDITARGYVGSLVGYQFNSTIEATAASGKVRGIDLQYGAIGGLVGFSHGSTISGCYISTLVSGPANITSIGTIAGRHTLSTTLSNNQIATP